MKEVTVTTSRLRFDSSTLIALAFAFVGVLLVGAFATGCGTPPDQPDDATDNVVVDSGTPPVDSSLPDTGTPPADTNRADTTPPRDTGQPRPDAGCSCGIPQAGHTWSEYCRDMTSLTDCQSAFFCSGSFRHCNLDLPMSVPEAPFACRRAQMQGHRWVCEGTSTPRGVDVQQDLTDPDHPVDYVAVPNVSGSAICSGQNCYRDGARSATTPWIRIVFASTCVADYRVEYMPAGSGMTGTPTRTVLCHLYD